MRRAAAGLADPASARDLVTLDAPSANVDEAKANYNADNPDRRLRANVLLPEGYDPARDYPVLFLLHGAGDAYTSWALPEKGAIAETAKDLDAIVVMPEGATAFYTDWFDSGERGAQRWETYYLEELIPLVERRFSVRPGRRWHAIAGLSMGGFGATFLGSRLPGYFGNVGAFSGALDIQDPGVQALFGGTDPSYQDYWGPADGPYAEGHNPAKLTGNLRASRVYVTTGDGTPEPGQPTSPAALTTGAGLEAGVKKLSDQYVAAARAEGVDVTYSPEHGVHDWPYWRRDVRELMAWGPFEPVPEAPSEWSYRTVAGRGDMWGLRFAFDRAAGHGGPLRAQGRDPVRRGQRAGDDRQRRGLRLHGHPAVLARAAGGSLRRLARRPRPAAAGVRAAAAGHERAQGAAAGARDRAPERARDAGPPRARAGRRVAGAHRPEGPRGAAAHVPRAPRPAHGARHPAGPRAGAGARPGAAGTPIG